LAPRCAGERLWLPDLIVDYWYEIGTTLLALDAVDRQVKVVRDNNSHEITAIVETTIGHGDECSADELRFSNLRIIGRPDECFKTRRLDTIPDGLVVTYHYNVNMTHGASGCCNEVEVSRREGQRNDHLFTWRQGYLHTPSYLAYYHHPYPLTVTTAHQPGIWQADSGPWQLIRYGAEDVTPEAVILGIYGVGPRAPLVRSLGDDRLTNIAEALTAKGTFADVHDALNLIAEAQRRGIVNDRTLKIAASVVGFDIPATIFGSDLDTYAHRLDQASLERLLENVMARITTPNICGECRNSSTSWIGLRPRLNDPAALVARLRPVFVDRNDLDTWQYEADLRLLRALALASKYGELAKGLDQAIDRSDPQQSKKADAFRRVFRGL
jgi:hypothetical protein